MPPNIHIVCHISNQSVLFATKLYFPLYGDKAYFMWPWHNPPDTDMTIITPTDKAVDGVTMEFNSN